MTDEELIAELREWSEYEAADRIEALVRERDEAKAMQACGCAYDTPTDICLGHLALFERVYASRIEALVQERDEQRLWKVEWMYKAEAADATEARLAKAVEALRAIKDVECIHCTDFFHGLADAVLAEIEGKP